MLLYISIIRRKFLTKSFLSLAIFLLGIGFYLGANYEGQISSREIQHQAAYYKLVNSATPTPTPFYSTFPTDMEHLLDYKTAKPVTRQIDVSGTFFYHYSYPPEITNVDSSQLVPMMCTHNITSNYYYQSKKDQYDDYQNIMSADNNYVMITKYYEVKNETPYDSLRKYIVTSTGINPVSFQYCKSDSSQYAEFTDLRTIYFAKYSQEFQKLIIIAQIPNFYAECGYPIQLTTKGDFYYICEGGDTITHSNIYRINENSTPPQPFYSCRTDPPGINPAPPTCSY